MSESTTVDALPQYDRSAIKTNIGFFSTLMRLIELRRESVIPAIVESYDRPTGMATVKPLAKRVYDTKDGEETKERESYTVPAWRFIQGGFIVDAPLYAGNTGLLIAADRNLTKAKENNSTIIVKSQTDEDKQNTGPERPDDNALAAFTWGFFIPLSWGDTGISNDDDHMIIRKVTDEGVKVEVTLGTDGIKFSGPVTSKHTFLTDVKLEDHNTLFKRSITASFSGDLIVDWSTETDWTEVGQVLYV